MNITDHRGLVAEPGTADRLRGRPNPGAEGCWAVAWLGVPHLTNYQCSFRARKNKLTCKIHRRLNTRARMLYRAQNDERLKT